MVRFIRKPSSPLEEILAQTITALWFGPFKPLGLLQGGDLARWPCSEIQNGYLQGWSSGSEAGSG